MAKVRKVPENSGSGKDDRLALALAQGMTQVDAALQAGITDRAVRKKLCDPAFRALVDWFRDRLISEAVGILATSGARAARKLNGLLNSDDESKQLQAAKIILTSLVQVGGYHDVTARLDAIEEAMKARGKL